MIYSKDHHAVEKRKETLNGDEQTLIQRTPCFCWQRHSSLSLSSLSLLLPPPTPLHFFLPLEVKGGHLLQFAKAEEFPSFPL